MKSRTSFFNRAVIKKDITRFAPAWGLYLTAMLLLSLTLFTEEEIHLAQTLGVTLGLFSVVNICYGFICAALLFGDLFNSRLCNALHAMPMRREGWFLTHLTSGMLFSVLPNLVISLFLLPRLGAYWYVAFIWVGGMSLTYLFFFGAAVLSAMCTGSRFAMTLVYGLINFLSILIMWIVQYLYKPLLYGIEINQMPFLFCSPISYLCSNELEFLPFVNEILSVGYYSDVNGWPYVTGMAVVGGLMMAVALGLYRKRHLEGAGDFITVRALNPVFLVLYTMAAGMALFLFSLAFNTDQDYLFLAVGIIVGYITGSMLLKRTVRVFKPTAFAGMAVLAAVLFGTLGLARLDVFGIVRWAPKAENVISLSIRHAYQEYAYEITDQAEIRELIAIHDGIIKKQDDNDYYWDSLYFTYQLDDGRTVTRRYKMDYTDPSIQALVPWFSSPEYVFQTDDVDGIAERMEFIELEFYYDKYYSDVAIKPLAVVEGEAALELLEAMIADCEAGHMVQDQNYYNRYSSEPSPIGYIRIHMAGGSTLGIEVWQEAVHTCYWVLTNPGE